MLQSSPRQTEAQYRLILALALRHTGVDVRLGYNLELSHLLRKNEKEWLELPPDTTEFWKEVSSYLASLGAFRERFSLKDLKRQSLFLCWKVYRISDGAELTRGPPKSQRQFTVEQNAHLMTLSLKVITPGLKIPNIDDGSIASMFGKIKPEVILDYVNSSPLFKAEELSLDKLDMALDALYGVIYPFKDHDSSPLCGQGELLAPPVNTASDSLSKVLQVRTSRSRDFPSRPRLMEM